VLREEVQAALRNAILSNEIQPGARLLEVEVATRMGVSRAPVREAIRQLEQEGLVEFFPHRGVVVIGLPDDEIDAIYEMRALIEAKAIVRACDRVTDADLDELGELLERMQRSLRARDIDAVADIDLRFHDKILEISGLTLLRRIWTSLAGLVRVRSYQALERPGKASTYFVKTSMQSHAALIDAMRRRDGPQAAELVRQHILEVASWLTDGAGTAGPQQ
jgi:DNA-binding GntR family transcriptional regulator